MATVQELEAQLRQARAKGKTNKVATLESQIRQMKQSQKTARGTPAPKLQTANGKTVKDLERQRKEALEKGKKAQQLTAQIQSLKGQQKEIKANQGGAVTTPQAAAPVPLPPPGQIAEEKSGQILQGIPDTYDLSQFDNLLPTYNEGTYKTAFDAAYNNATYGLDEQEKRRRQEELQYLADTGNPMGSANYDNRLGDMGKEFEGYRTNARNYATTTAGTEAERLFGLGRSAYDAAVGSYNMKFDKPIEYGNALAGITAADYAMAQNDKEFQENVRQFGITVALEKRKTRLALASQGGGSSGGGADTSPLIAGNGFNI